jgi:hypothetical protein
LSISGNKIRKLESYSRIKKKTHNITNIFTIFILLSFLTLEPTTYLVLKIYGQSNGTSLPSENAVQIILENPAEETDEIVGDEELIAENTSTSGSDGIVTTKIH